ncbi:MAG: oligoendopeptidase F, partial [Acetobacteraceae bacterium]|nr:oligoendopeptidase F [Acetobacteraceae bacterium]
MNYAGNTAETLPAWDLSDLYPGPDSDQVDADFRTAEEEARGFASVYAGKLSSLPGRDMAEAIVRYERIEETLGRLISYAQLLFSGD